MSNTQKYNQEARLDASGTCLQGYLEALYSELVNAFGESAKDGFDAYKSDVEWVVQTPYGVATIYNYKDGKNYLGEEGLSVDEIEEWHIGAHNKESAAWVQGYFRATS